jgi:hypothetical protein
LLALQEHQSALVALQHKAQDQLREAQEQQVIQLLVKLQNFGFICHFCRELFWHELTKILKLMVQKIWKI